MSSLVSTVQGQQVPTCRDWQDCRRLALEAAAQEEYERFHDLAWRAVQTGPKNDPALMYVLARAQVLSGRPHDALVMLQRLAATGVATEAVTDPDFTRTRALPGWPEVAAAIAGAEKPLVESVPARAAAAPRNPVPAPAPAPAPPDVAAIRKPAVVPSPGAPAVVLSPGAPVASTDAVRFSTSQFLAAGLAYDAVSRRFVIGDARGRKLIVVGDQSGQADNLVRGESAGFDDVVALSIDELRGNLWVVSTSDTGGESALHRLQLVSGRSLKTYRAPPSMGATWLIDIAVQVSGAVIVLDHVGDRLLSLANGAADMTVAMPLKLSGPRSITGRNDSVLYVAHDEGIARVDLRARAVSPLSAPAGLDLKRFDAIRAHRDVLFGLQTTPAGSRQLVRLTLNPAGRAVTGIAVVDPQMTETDRRLSLTIAGDELYYLATEAGAVGPAPSSNDSLFGERFIIRRLSLR